jgi:hypothetical protein
MLLTTGRGRCYSFTEVKGWLEQAGFRRSGRNASPRAAHFLPGHWDEAVMS